VFGGHRDEIRATILFLCSLLTIPIHPSEERIDMHGTPSDDDEQSPHDESTLIASSGGFGEDIEANVEEDRCLGEVG
jgi:hypothetical protein